MINDLDYKETEFPVSKNDFSKIEVKTKFVSVSFPMKTNRLIPFMDQIKNLKIQWIGCLYLMKINQTMCTSKIFTDLCLVKQKAKTKNAAFAKASYIVLVIKMYWQSIRKFV